MHGGGLFAARPIPAQTFIIEYIGKLIPASLQDSLERKYLGRGLSSTYMFTLDKETVIDATCAVLLLPFSWLCFVFF